MKNKILILGKNGQLAQSLISQFKKKKINAKSISSKELNFNYPKKVSKFLIKKNFEIIINCFAYTKVDAAEKDRSKCRNINEVSPMYLAKFCEQNDKLLIHFSTDYIFSKKKKLPISENEKTNPINFYGKTKLNGERAIVNSKCNFLIFRLSWTYSKYGKNFLKTIIKLLKNKKKINVVGDQVGCPTNLDFVSSIVEIFTRKYFKEKKIFKEIFHISHNRSCSWFNFAKEIEKKFFGRKKSKIIKVSSEEFKTLAKRPKYSKFSNYKLKKYLHLKNLSDWRAELNKFCKKNKSANFF